MRQITIQLFILLTIYLTHNVSTLSTSYETQVVFYHEQVFPKDYYWILMQMEYQGKMKEAGDRVRSGLGQLARDVKMLKDIVDEENSNRQQYGGQQIFSSNFTNKKTIFPAQQHKLTLIINNDNHQQNYQQAFSTKLTHLQQHLNQFQLTLSSINIQMNNPYSVRQDVYLRVPKNKRQQLGQLVDRIQKQFSGSENVRILTVEEGNKNSYTMVWEGNKEELYEKNVRQLVDEEDLIATINEQAQTYCSSLNMHLSEIKSFHPLIDETLHNNQTQQQQTQLPTQQPQQLPYDEAYNIISNRQFDDYENVFYEVKVICKGDQRPQRVHAQQKKSDKNKISNKKNNRNKTSKRDKIQHEINKLNNILQNQSNN